MSWLLVTLELRKRRNLPSADQSVHVFTSSDFSSSSSAPPTDGFQNKLCGPPRRVELNAMRVPSGDHSGKLSTDGSTVKRVRTPRGSMIHTSTLPLRLRYIAMRRLSGDIDTP